MSIAAKQSHAIGVFDSGLGGLTVVKALMKQLPWEDIVYYGDTARVPYGTKSKETIIRFSVENAEVLLQEKVKMIVVACNSSSSFALSTLKKKFRVPIVGVLEPGAEKAAGLTQNKRIGVIATSATVNSRAYNKALKRLKAGIRVFARSCPLFVPLVEEGWLKKKVTMDVIGEYLKPLKQARVDTLILGCTHYPLLKASLQKVMGKKVTLVDSAQEVAGEVKRILKRSGRLRTIRHKPHYRFLLSDRPQEFKKIVREFLGYNINRVKTIHNV